MKSKYKDKYPSEIRAFCLAKRQTKAKFRNALIRLETMFEEGDYDSVVSSMYAVADKLLLEKGVGIEAKHQ